MNRFKNLDPIYTSQIRYTGDLLDTENCTLGELCTGTNMDDIIALFYNGICSINSNCTIKTNADDTTCDYLTNKITSLDSSVNKTINIDIVTGARTLDLSVSDSVILHNDWTDTTASSGDMKSYTLPVNSLQTDGDQLIIESYYYTAVTSASVTVTSYLGAIVIYPTIFGGTNKYFKLVTTITRLDVTDIRFEIDLKWLDVLGFQTGNQIIVSSSTPVSSLLTNTFNIKSTVSGGSVTQKYLTVKINKS